MVCLVVALFPAVVQADGMLISPPHKPMVETGQKAVIWHDGKRETLVLSTTFRGEAEDFAWIIPVPNKPEVTSSKDELFTALDDYTRPKYNNRYDSAMPMIGSVSTVGMEESGVTVVESKKVDVYDITVLEAVDGKSLREWLTKNGYEYPTNRDLLLQHYALKRWFFVAAKISTEALGYMGTSLRTGHMTPLMISFDSEGIVYPLKISGPGSKYNEADKLAAYGFEMGSEKWSGGTVIAKDAWQGVSVYRLTVPSYGNAELGNAMGYKSISGLKTGVDYVFSAYVKAKPGASGEAKLRVSGGGIERMSNVVDLATNDEWRRLQVVFRPTSSSTPMLNLMVEGSPKTEVYWDGIQFEKGIVPTAFEEEVLDSTTSQIANESVNIILYVFSNHKKTVPGFSVGYAGDVSAKEIQKMAYQDDGTPWMKTNKKMYLTKLSRSMTQAQMTDDLIIRDAEDNDAVGGGQAGLGDGWGRTVLVLGLPLGLEIGGIYYFWYSRLRRKEKQK